MLNFKNTNIIFIIIIFSMIMIEVYLPFSQLWYLFPLFIYLSVLFCGSKNICSQFYTKVKCSSEDKSKLHLTFDDGPQP